MSVRRRKAAHEVTVEAFDGNVLTRGLDSPRDGNPVRLDELADAFDGMAQTRSDHQKRLDEELEHVRKLELRAHELERKEEATKAKRTRLPSPFEAPKPTPWGRR